MDVWISRARHFLSRRTPLAVIVVFCLAAFLWVLAFGSPPRALGLDPSWTEVLAWGILNHAQWGRDLVFTYGPLGFLQPYASYVKGIFPWYAAGEIFLPAGFAFSIGLMLRRSTLLEFGVFALVYISSCSQLGGDVSWALTLLFGTSYLLAGRDRLSAPIFYISLTLLAAIFAAVALTKFSLFPLWLACAATLTGACLIAGDRYRAGYCLVIFPLTLVAVWILCGQQLQYLPLYLSRSLEIATGYGHAMGNRAPLIVEFAALGLLGTFLLACAHAAWVTRTDRLALASLGLMAAASVLFWLAFFTRGDHWPWFFPAIALLPFALLCNDRLDASRILRATSFALALIGIVAACVVVGPSTIVREFSQRIRNNIHNLTHLPELWDHRESEWRTVERDAALPKIRERVGDARIDLLTYEQGMILVNSLNYAPRPVFQSYSAYTPKLARLNESYFLGSDAPPFVVLKLDPADERVPMSEDGLALIALLRHYRPVLIEKRLLLLQRDESVASAEPLLAHASLMPATLGAEVPVTSPGPGSPAAIFINLELSAFGKIYTLLFREPPLEIVLTPDKGEAQRYRLVRLTAASGFVLTPVIKSAGDWIKQYFSKPLPEVKSFRVDAQSSWDRWIFQSDFTFAIQGLDVLRPDTTVVPPELAATLLYPGFNLSPTTPGEIRIVTEAEQDAVYVHAPGSLSFQPPSGRYGISATFGVQAIAINDPGCARANADGIGVSLVRRRGGRESPLWHAEVDPFHVPRDRGPQRLGIDGVDILNGDIVDYRVDPGHHGSNISCDWSFVRDFVFTRRGDVTQGISQTGYDGFNIKPVTAVFRVILEEDREAVFLHAPSAIAFKPAPGRYSITGIFGVQTIAWKDPGCAKANADGVGVSLVLHHAGKESVAWHGELDPFHAPKDRGSHRLALAAIDIAPGDSVDYRVDPGHGGSNVSCDWSYLRELTFTRKAGPARAAQAKSAGGGPKQ